MVVLCKYDLPATPDGLSDLTRRSLSGVWYLSPQREGKT